MISYYHIHQPQLFQNEHLNLTLLKPPEDLAYKEQRDTGSGDYDCAARDPMTTSGYRNDPLTATQLYGNFVR